MLVIENELAEVHKLELEIEQTGHITNTYIIKDKATSKVCVIDPAFNANVIKKEIESIAGVLEVVLITHSHADHIAALANLVENVDVKVYIHSLDYEGLYNSKLNYEDIVQTKVIAVDKNKVIKIENKEQIDIGNTKLEALHTPGHTKGGMVFVDRLNNLLYSGDTVFENTYGRTDLVGGSHDDMEMSLEKLFNEFDSVIVLPGHGKIFNLKDSKRKIKLLFSYKG